MMLWSKMLLYIKAYLILQIVINKFHFSYIITLLSDFEIFKYIYNGQIG